MPSDSYQQSFQDFMLGRSSNASSPSDSKETKDRTTVSPVVGTKEAHSLQAPLSQSNKRIGPALKAFVGLLRQWDQLDEEAAGIVRSIHNLRTRHAWERQLLSELSDRQMQETSPSFEEFDFHINSLTAETLVPSQPPSHVPVALSDSDVEKALSADLRRHERMAAMLRSTMSSLDRTHERLGRRLDELMVFDGLCSPLHDVNSSHAASLTSISRCEQAYVILSERLYVKQVLAGHILDSFVGNAGAIEPDENTRICMDRWDCLDGALADTHVINSLLAS